ncbi:flagellar biosynthesis anti-sigma factor FlgM [Candidatus Haliotispira prima]|uniref:Flagellar biosynthesis anti-sigma factor FlgM n=1 Tax=Candidatus Haliotispira prima TaxID=3034016 RepID=A0ABY8MDW9_9SPIO|nr:flagellar biosynthesis anti-sigma factor FlgM [Candidatus Haliotispira prima]
MPIDKISSTEHYTVVKRSIVRPQQPVRQVEQDTISLTKAAKQSAEIRRARGVAMSVPDIRSGRVSELLDKLQDPSYPDQVVIGSTADRLLDHWNV